MRSRMNSTPRLGSLLGSAAALCLSFSLSPATAGTDNCAAYAPGFASLEGSDTCIRIGGHVRVEVSSGSTSSTQNNGWASGSARPASLYTTSDGDRHSNHSLNGMDLSSSHLRLRQGVMGYAGPLR